MCASRTEHVNTMVCELHWLSICILIQFQVMVIPFNAPHDMEPACLKDCFFSFIAIPSGLAGETCYGSYQPGSLIGWDLIGKPFLSWPLWNNIFPEVQLVPTLFVLQKPFKTKFCQQAQEFIVKWIDSSSLRCALCKTGNTKLCITSVYLSTIVSNNYTL